MSHFPLTPDADLRLLEGRHADEIYAAIDRNRARLRQWMPWVDDSRGPDDVKTFIRASLQRFAINDGFAAGIFVAGQFVGTIDFHHFGWINRKTSLGYWLDAEHEGRGLMTAAVRARRLLRHLMTSQRLDFRLASRSKPEGDSSLTSR